MGFNEQKIGISWDLLTILWAYHGTNDITIFENCPFFTEMADQRMEASKDSILGWILSSSEFGVSKFWRNKNAERSLPV